MHTLVILSFWVSYRFLLPIDYFRCHYTVSVCVCVPRYISDSHRYFFQLCAIFLNGIIFSFVASLPRCLVRTQIKCIPFWCTAFASPIFRAFFLQVNFCVFSSLSYWAMPFLTISILCYLFFYLLMGKGRTRNRY